VHVVDDTKNSNAVERCTTREDSPFRVSIHLTQNQHCIDSRERQSITNSLLAETTMSAYPEMTVYNEDVDRAVEEVEEAFR
jgi:hypothetical protein